MKRKNENAPYWVMLRKAEKDIIEWGIKQASGSIAQAATLLGVNTGHLYRRCRDLGIRTEKRKYEKKCETPSSDSSQATSSDE